MVITSHDPLRWNFSDSTDLSESLLIATRRGAGDISDERHRTTFVNLWQNPEGILDSHRLAQAITRTRPAKLEEAGSSLLEVDGRHVGETVSMPTPMIVGKKWSGVQFSRADLIRSALKLVDDGEVWVPGEASKASVALCRLDALGQVGPDRRRLVDGFDRTDTVTAYPMVEGHDTERRRSLVCSTDVFLSSLIDPRGGQQAGYGERLWQQAA